MKIQVNKIITLSSSGFIVTVLCCSVFAYYIVPDKTKHANQQFPEIALLSPGSAVAVKSAETAIQAPKGFMEFLVNGYGAQRLYQLCDGEEACHQEMRFWFGTDKYGRDVFSRVVLGMRYTLLISLLSVLVSIFLGLVLGILSGYAGGRVDKFIGFLINIFWTLPTILLAFAVLLAFGRNMMTLFIAIGLTLWSDVARLVRGQVLAVKELGYIQAAKALGLGEWRTMFRHILPNIINPVWVLAASNFSMAVLLESGLSFLGFGLEPPLPTLGNILQEQYIYALSGKPFLAIIPCIVVVLLILSFQLVTNYLKEAFDAKQSNKT